jgi:hypothetical protein
VESGEESREIATRVTCFVLSAEYDGTVYVRMRKG